MLPFHISLQGVPRRVFWHRLTSEPHSASCPGYIVSLKALGMITVSFSFMGISQSLPTTSYMKWIDFWMMFSIIMPFLEVLAQAGNYMLRGETIEICNSDACCFPSSDSSTCVEPMEKHGHQQLKSIGWFDNWLSYLQTMWLLFRRKLRLMGMRVTSTLALPIGYLIFVIIWSISVNSIIKS